MDQKQFEIIFNSYYPTLYMYVNTHVKNSAVAEEIATEALMKLWGFRYIIESDVGIKGFLFMHTKHAIDHHLRENEQSIKNLQPFFDTLKTSHKKEESIKENVIQKLHDRIDTLPCRIKHVVKLSMLGLQVPEIAELMSASNQTVNNLKSQAYKFLRTELPGNLNEASNNTSITIEQISIIKDEINTELIRYFAQHPHKMYDLDAYKFEKLVAELMTKPMPDG
jgi:RNA polymerase sigma-70 factor (ECF subfamily)